MPRIVEPEDEDTFGIARPSGLPSGTGSSGRGFAPGKKVKSWKASPQIPHPAHAETEQLLKKRWNLPCRSMESEPTGTRGRRPGGSRGRKAPTDDQFKGCGISTIVSVSTNTSPIREHEEVVSLGSARKDRAPRIAAD